MPQSNPSSKKTKKYAAYKNAAKQLSQKPVWQKKIKPSTFYISVTSLALLLASVTVYSSFAIQRVVSHMPAAYKSVSQWKLEQEVRSMTGGYPINSMLTQIFAKDEITAAYLIGIAKKESNWGKVAPSKDGKDCYNYWGFKGKGTRGVAAGHTCFGSPDEAVDAVASRISSLVYDYNRTTPRELVVWKCGYSCKGHSNESVEKWIRDVAFYKNKLESAKN
jgi:hypothetical protein